MNIYGLYLSLSGYSNLFSLHKDDLWAALNEYPEARNLLLNIGREILAKDNMIDEEKAKREEDAKMTVDQKIILLKEHVKGIKTRFDRLKKDYSSFSDTCSDKLHSIHSNMKQ